MRLINKLKKKKFLLILSVFFILLVLFPHLASANVALDALGTVASVLVGMLGWLITLVIRILVAIAQYNNFINSPVVSKGWILIRDLCNMFFILILLIIAFSTVLGYERWHYKKMLPALLIAAVLINFSKLICGALIDLSQVIMLTFVAAFAPAAEGNFAQLVGLTELLEMSERLGQTVGEKIGDWEIAASYVLAVIFALIFLVVLIAILALLLIRIIYLWFLTVLSPFPFIGQIVPGLPQSYANRWWAEFTKQLFIGPILAIFLWLSLSMVGGEGGEAIVMPIVEGGKKLEAVGATNITEPSTMLSYCVGIAMLLGTLMIAQEFGGVGAKVGAKASGFLNKTVQGALKGGRKAVGFGAGRISQWTGAAPRISRAKEKTKTWATRMGLTEVGLKMRDLRRREKYERGVGRGVRADALLIQREGLEKQRLEGFYGFKFADLSPNELRNRLKKTKGLENRIVARELNRKVEFRPEDVDAFLQNLSPEEGSEGRKFIEQDLGEKQKEGIKKDRYRYHLNAKFPDPNKQKDLVKDIEDRARGRKAGQIENELEQAGIEVGDIEKGSDIVLNHRLLGYNEKAIQRIENDPLKEAIFKARQEMREGKRGGEGNIGIYKGDEPETRERIKEILGPTTERTVPPKEGGGPGVPPKEGGGPGVPPKEGGGPTPPSTVPTIEDIKKGAVRPEQLVNLDPDLISRPIKDALVKALNINQLGELFKGVNRKLANELISILRQERLKPDPQQDKSIVEKSKNIQNSEWFH